MNVMLCFVILFLLAVTHMEVNNGSSQASQAKDGARLASNTGQHAYDVPELPFVRPYMQAENANFQAYVVYQVN